MGKKMGVKEAMIEAVNNSNTTKLKQMLLPLALMFAFLFFWYNANNIAEKLSSQNVSLRYSVADSKKSDTVDGENESEGNENGISKADLQMLKEKEVEMPQILIWDEKPEQTIKTKQNSSANSSVIRLLGENILPIEITSGSPLSQNDQMGCSIDESTAYTLFGTTEVVGKSIIINEQSLVIRGIFKFEKPLVMVNFTDEESETEKLANAELLFDKTQNGRESATAFLSKHGLPIPSAMLDGSYVSIFMSIAMAFPAIIIAVLLVLRMLKRVLGFRNQLLLFLLAFAFTVVISVILMHVLNLFFEMPTRLIPSRWSDFAFWGKQLKDIGGHLGELITNSVTVIENALFGKAAALLCLLVGEVFTLVLFLERVKIKSARELALWAFAVEAALLVILLSSSAALQTEMRGYALFLALPCYFAVDLLIYKCDEAFKPIAQKENENAVDKAKYHDRFKSDEEDENPELV